MATTYSGFLVDLNRLIDGDDVSVSDIPVATLQAIASLGERRIYREVRSRYNEVAYAVSVASNAAVIPADFEANSMMHFGKGPLTPISEELCRQYIWDQTKFSVQYFAEAGSSFIFAPVIADATAVQGRYYARLPNLDATTLPTNALYAANPDLFLYAALCESAPFFGQDARMPLWNAKYTSIKDAINEEKQRAAYSTGRMQMRPSALLGGRRGSNVT